MSMEGFRFSQSENGRILWRMRARNADLYENKEAQLKDLRSRIITPDRKEAALLGETGTMDTVTGNAAILRSAGSQDRYERRISADHEFCYSGTRQNVWYSRRIHSNCSASEIYLEGKGVSANLDMRTIEVNSNVKAVLQE